ADVLDVFSQVAPGKIFARRDPAPTWRDTPAPPPTGRPRPVRIGPPPAYGSETTPTRLFIRPTRSGGRAAPVTYLRYGLNRFKVDLVHEQIQAVPGRRDPGRPVPGAPGPPREVLLGRLSAALLPGPPGARPALRRLRARRHPDRDLRPRPTAEVLLVVVPRRRAPRPPGRRRRGRGDPPQHHRPDPGRAPRARAVGAVGSRARTEAPPPRPLRPRRELDGSEDPVHARRRPGLHRRPGARLRARRRYRVPRSRQLHRRGRRALRSRRGGPPAEPFSVGRDLA